MTTRNVRPLVPRPPSPSAAPPRTAPLRASTPAQAALHVRDVIAEPAVCCEPLTSLLDAARLLAAHDCGAIPVLEPGSRRPLGVVASRDIVCRVLSTGRDARRLRVVDAMTEPVVTVGVEARVDEAADLMERHGVPRLVAVDAAGRCAGVVSLADLVHALPLARLGALLVGASSAVGAAPKA